MHLGAVEACVAVLAGGVEHAWLHEAVGAGVGEGVDEDGVNDAEDGTCGGDAEGEGENGGEGEGGAFAEFAERGAQVGEKGVHMDLVRLGMLLCLDY